VGQDEDSIETQIVDTEENVDTLLTIALKDENLNMMKELMSMKYKGIHDELRQSDQGSSRFFKLFSTYDYRILQMIYSNPEVIICQKYQRDAIHHFCRYFYTQKTKIMELQDDDDEGQDLDEFDDESIADDEQPGDAEKKN
jgi:hypothetical protein